MTPLARIGLISWLITMGIGLAMVGIRVSMGLGHAQETAAGVLGAGVFFGISAAVMAVVSRLQDVNALRVVGWAYGSKVVILGLAALVVTVPDAFDRRAFGLAVAITAGVFVVTESVLLARLGRARKF